MRTKRMLQALALIVCLGLVLAPAAAPAQNSKAQSATPTTEKVNINTATAEQLQTLPGIGPALAKSIVDYRTKTGKFKKIEELINVKGVGEKKFEQIKDRLTV
jgi:competence protein ComEA